MNRTTSVVTTKGQLVIPASLRRRLNIREGTVVVFTEEEGRLVIQPITPEFIRTLRGSLKTNGSVSNSFSAERRKATPS